MGQIKPTATLCGKPHESEDAHQSRIRYGEGKAQKRDTLKHRNTRPCLACFRSEMIIIITIIVGYDNNTPFLSPCIRKAEHFNCAWKTHTRRKRQCFRSEMIIIITIIVGYDNNTPFLSPCIRKAEHFNCAWKTHTRRKRQCYLFTYLWLEKITSSPEWTCSLTFSSVFRQEWLERTPGLEAFWKKYKESVQEMLDAMETEAKVGRVFFSLSLELTRTRIFIFRYLTF